MSDIINAIDNGKGESELWVTIKDASDLLGISERHAWNIITSNGLKSKKLLNQHRKKTYVLRADIEQFQKAEQERQRLEAIKASSLSEKSAISEKKGEFEISESGTTPISERGQAISEVAKSLPAMLKDMQTKQEVLQKDVVKWRVTAFWVTVLGLTIAGLFYVSLNEAKKSLSESQNAISEKDKVISQSQNALSEMSERVFTISEREKTEVQTLNDKESYIKKLEDNIPKDKLEKLQTKE